MVVFHSLVIRVKHRSKICHKGSSFRAYRKRLKVMIFSRKSEKKLFFSFTLSRHYYFQTLSACSKTNYLYLCVFKNTKMHKKMQEFSWDRRSTRLLPDKEMGTS